MSQHDCIQTRRLFIIERDATSEIAKRREYEEHTYELLTKISKEISELANNMSKDLQSMKKEISGLSKTIKKSNG